MRFYSPWVGEREDSMVYTALRAPTGSVKQIVLGSKSRNKSSMDDRGLFITFLFRTVEGRA